VKTILTVKYEDDGITILIRGNLKFNFLLWSTKGDYKDVANQFA
jgi:hypothetical protein